MGLRKVCALLWVCLLPIFLIGISSTGCSKNSSPTIPDSDNQNTPDVSDSGIFRGIWWNDPYVVIDDDDYINEQNVDITNIVYGTSWHQQPGVVRPGWLKRGLIPNVEYMFGTVAAWQEPVYDGETIDEWNIYFRLLYRDGGQPEDEKMGDIFSFGEADGLDQVSPAITAHFSINYIVVVDIVYMQRQAQNPHDNWEIWHARFEETSPYIHNFQMVGFPQPISDPSWLDNCTRPDIVFDAGYPDLLQAINRLHVTFVKAVEFDDREIWYRRAEEQFGGYPIWAPPGIGYMYLTYNTPGLNDRPRIDVGYDDSGYIGHGWPLETQYYVGVVWEHGDWIWEGELSDWQFDIYFFMIPIGGLYTPYIPYSVPITDGGFGHFNVFPHIEIAPIENIMRTTFITWTHAVNAVEPPDHDWVDVKIECTNTHRLIEIPHNPIVSLFDGHGPLDPGGRNGLATFAIQATGDGWQKGCLVWLNDLYDPEDPDPENLIVDVWAGQVKFSPMTGEIFPQPIYLYSPIEISMGDSSWNYDKFNFGPEVAVFGLVKLKCIWTDYEEIPPDYVDTGIHSDTDGGTIG